MNKNKILRKRRKLLQSNLNLLMKIIIYISLKFIFLIINNESIP